MAKRVINVGIIGLGPDWGTRYQPVLEKLWPQMRVRVVYDHVVNRAVQVAGEFDARPSMGVLALADAADVQALLVLDTDWHGLHLMNFLCARHKPIYLAGEFSESLLQLEQLHSTAVLTGVTLMPELAQRHTPATARLQELLATKLGSARQIEISCRIKPSDPVLPDLFDWCRYVMHASPVKLSAARVDLAESDAAASPIQITLEFKPTKNGAERVARINLAAAGDDSKHAAPQFRVRCVEGEAEVVSPTSISWSSGGSSKMESLTADRSAVEVMLDHFCRRVVGGLIPVPDLSDVCRALVMRDAVEHSLRTGETVKLSPRKKAPVAESTGGSEPR